MSQKKIKKGENYRELRERERERDRERERERENDKDGKNGKPLSPIEILLKLWTDSLFF